MRLYNTASRKLEEFKPLKEGKVAIYSCGPTVYDYAHIGNFRAFLFADLVRRWFRFNKYQVTQVMNITDVDDKIIKKATAKGVTAQDITKEYEQAFYDDLATLNIERFDVHPRATEHIDEMVAMIQSLLDKGIAYKADDGSIYYSVAKFPGYGTFAHLDLAGMQEGARVKNDEYTKDAAHDFALWKAWDADDGEVYWETPLGKGRPGWHIECSAMSTKYLGSTFDIHTGGIDLVFPHHQNEIAQSEGASGKPFARYWLHNEHLLVEGKKMSKSLGNFFTLRDLLGKGIDPRALRLTLLSAHYRQQLNFTMEGLDGWERALRRIDDAYLVSAPAADAAGPIADAITVADGAAPQGADRAIDDIRSQFKDALADDLNTSVALAAVFEMVKLANAAAGMGPAGETLLAADKAALHDGLADFYAVFGISLPEAVQIPQDILDLAAQRETHRARKEWAQADAIRQQVAEQGYRIDDTDAGPSVVRA